RLRTCGRLRLGLLAWCRLLPCCVLLRPVDNLGALSDMNFGRVPLDSVLLVFASLHLAADQNALALVQPLAKELGGLAKGNAAHPFGLLDLLPGLLVLVAVVDGNVEVGDGVAVWHEANFNFVSTTTDAAPFV